MQDTKNKIKIDKSNDVVEHKSNDKSTKDPKDPIFSNIISNSF